MSGWSPLGAYLPRRGPLHRLPSGAKLLGLVCFAVAVTWTRGVPITAVWLGIAVALAVLSGLRGRHLWRVARGFAFIAIPLFLFATVNEVSTATSEPFTTVLRSPDWLLHGWPRGFEVVGDLLALILAASAVTASTAVADMLDTIARALEPLRPLRVDPDRVALAVSLVITAIPNILGIARETRAAAQARGLERSVRALLVPFALRTVAHAQSTGEALAARGVGEE